MKRIGIIIGSESDLTQCERGLSYLMSRTSVEVLFVNVTSVHRNTTKLFADLEGLSKAPASAKVNALIIGAGWANHLSGTSDAFLRNHLKDTSILVYAVAFEDPKDAVHTQAATLSITQVPGTKAIFRNYVGSEGFYRACYDAVNDEPVQIDLAPVKKPLEFTFSEALTRCQELLIEKQRKEN